MPHSDWRQRIHEILSAIESIETYVAGMDRDAFLADERTVDSVAYRLLVIGEAANHVPETVRSQHPEVPWKRMRDMRNVLAHEYFGVDASVIWGTLQMDLPRLVDLLRALLEER